MALVVLLRGVNVGGHRTFRPATLARELAHLDAVNIGAAGTLVIRRPVTRSRLRAEVVARLPFAGEVAICHGREIERIAAGDPFAGQRARADVVRCLSVLSRQPRRAPDVPLTVPARGAWMVRILAREGRFLVGLHRRQMKAIGCLGQLDELFGVTATTRSWSTVAAIVRALR